MKLSNSFKISTLNLKLLESKRPFLLFAEILSTKLFPQSKYTKQSKLKAILETSTFQIPKFEIFISNGSFCNFYSNLPKAFFILKMSNKKSSNLKWAPFEYSEWKLSSQTDHFVFFSPTLRKTFFIFKMTKRNKKTF